MNRRFFSLILLAVAMQGCGRAELRISGFEKEVEAFEQASVEAGHPLKVTDLIIEFKTQAKDQFASCHANEGNTPRIEIDHKAWDGHSEEDRESLLFHELGHCILHRAHRSGSYVDEDGMRQPLSLMTPAAVGGANFHLRHQHYIEELFSN
jgi:hypothetical protein